MSKKVGIAVSVIAVIALCISAFSLFTALKPEKKEQGDIQYVLYLGTNDKNTNKPVFTPDEAKKEAEKILIKHFGGYTIQEANGGWEENGKLYKEYTLVIYLSDTDIYAVHSAAKEMIDVFNQSSVLIQCNSTSTEFYSGD